MKTLEQKLAENEALKVEIENSLKEFLYTNRGRCTTKGSDDNILRVLTDLETINYNIGFYKAAIACGRK